MSVTIEGVGTQPKEGLVDSRSALYYIYVCFIHIFSFLSFWVVTKKTQQKKHLSMFSSMYSLIFFSALLIISFAFSNKFIHNYPIVIKTTLSQANLFYHDLINVCFLFVLK